MRFSSVLSNTSLLLSISVLATSNSNFPSLNFTSGNFSSGDAHSRVVISFAEANDIIGWNSMWLDQHDKMIKDLFRAGKVNHHSTKAACERVHKQTFDLVGPISQWYRVHDDLVANITSMRCTASFKAMNMAVGIDTKSAFHDFMVGMVETVVLNQTEAPMKRRLKAFKRVQKKMRDPRAWEKYRQSLILQIVKLLGANCGWGPDVVKEIERDLQNLMVELTLDGSGQGLIDWSDEQLEGDDDDDNDDEEEEEEEEDDDDDDINSYEVTDVFEERGFAPNERAFLGGIWPIPKPKQ